MFLPFWRSLPIFTKVKNCRLQTFSVWNSLKFCRLVKSYGLNVMYSNVNFMLIFFSFTNRQSFKVCGLFSFLRLKSLKLDAYFLSFFFAPFTKATLPFPFNRKSIFLSVSVFLFVCLSVFLLSVCLSISLSLCLSLSVSLSFSSLSLSLSLSLSVCLSFVLRSRNMKMMDAIVACKTRNIFKQAMSLKIDRRRSLKRDQFSVV